VRALALMSALALGSCGGSASPADDAHGAGPAPTARPVDGSEPPEAALAELPPLPAGASREEMIERASKIGDRLRVRSDRVQRWLRDARRAQYGNQTACLDDHLSQLHAAERDSMESIKAARAADSREDDVMVRRELSRLMVLEERSRVLVHTARSCGRPKPPPTPVALP
jgi:hypothetical protein